MVTVTERERPKNKRITVTIVSLIFFYFKDYVLVYIKRVSVKPETNSYVKQTRNKFVKVLADEYKIQVKANSIQF